MGLSFHVVVRYDVDDGFEPIIRDLFPRAH